MKQVSWTVERGPEADSPGKRMREEMNRTLRAPESSVVPRSEGETPLSIGMCFYGLRERFPDGTLNPMISRFFDTTWYDEGDASDAWCSAFVNYCVEEAGLEGTNSPRARSWLEWGAAKRIEDVERGDIMVFSRGQNPSQGHVGFYYDVTPRGSYLVYGGNQNNQITVSTYSKSRLLSVRTPTSPIQFGLETL